MNAGLDKKLRRAISILEGNPPQINGLPTNSKRNKDPVIEACNDVRKVLVDDEYWPKAYTSRALNGLFDVLDKDDASIRILADQCLNNIFRNSLAKGQSSRTLAVLLNELGRKVSARGFVAALTMLEATLPHAREARMEVYAMNLLNSLKEALKRPEQAVQGVIEQLFGPILNYFKADLKDSHYNYVDALSTQCLENFQLSGVSSRAASSTLGVLYENYPKIRNKIHYNLLDVLSSAEERNDKNRIVGVLNTFKKIWTFLDSGDIIHSVMHRVLCAMRTNSNEIQTAGLELLEIVVSSSSLDVLDFRPGLFTNSEARRSSVAETIANLTISELDLALDVDEQTKLSRANSVSSLEEPFPPTRSEVSDENDGLNNPSDDEDTKSDRTSKSEMDQADTDPLFRRSSPSEYLLDSVEEQKSLDSPTRLSNEIIYGPLCDDLPKIPNMAGNFLEYASYIILRKFIFTGTPGELKSDAEVRVSVKVIALKVLAAISAKYYRIYDLVIGQQSFLDIQILVSSSDDTLSLRCFEMLANLEAELIKNGIRAWPVVPPSKFSVHLNQLMQHPNPMKLKELFQVLSKVPFVLQAEQNILKTVLNTAIETIDCDYFLLKIVRADFLAKIKWETVNMEIREAYQKKCFQVLIKGLFDLDYRVSNAVSELLPIAVRNAEFSQLSNSFNCQWPEEMVAPSFPCQPQIYGLHPNYSFRGDCPDLVLEHTLCEAITMLYDEFTTRSSTGFGAFVQGLLRLAEAYSPCIYGEAWGCQDQKRQGSILDILIEQIDCFTVTPTDFINSMKLMSILFCGLMENSLSQYANQPKEKDFFQRNGTLDQIITIYLRVLNLYFTVIRENTTKVSSGLTSPLFTKRNWVQGGGNTSATENRSYSISHLVGTGVHPTRQSSYTQSLSLRRIEPLIRGAISNLQTSLKKQTEHRATALLNTALDGLSAILELMSRDLMNSFIDELFIYIRTFMLFSLAPVTQVITQLLKAIFDKNAYHINPNVLVSLRLKNAVMPSDPLEMYIGRSINGFSVYLAFLDRAEHFTLHQLRHFGWMNRIISSPVAKRSDYHALEIGTRLEQFERFVTSLMHAFLHNSQPGIRENVLSLLGVLVMNDFRYDKLDPQSRIWKLVLQLIRHPTLKYVKELKGLFTFICLVTRMIDVSFDEVISLMGKCLEKLDENNCDRILDALHIVFLEAIGYYAVVSQGLIDLLKQENTGMMTLSPGKTIQFWTIVLHWARTTQPDMFYLDLSTVFVNELVGFIDRDNFKVFKERDKGFELGNSIIIALKTTHPSTFKPVNTIVELFMKSMTVGWLESLPFMSFLLCRIDLDLVLVQMNDIVKNPVEKLSRILSQLYFSAVDEVNEVTDVDQTCCLADAITFYQISLLHILRANPAFFKQFKLLFSEILEEKQFIQKVLRLAFLSPKVYGVFMTILVQLDIFSKEVAKLFYSNSLPSNAKQLTALLLMQKITDRRAAATPEFEQFLTLLPREMTARLVKLSSEKQLFTMKQRLRRETVDEMVKKCKEYMKDNPIPALNYGVQLLADGALSPGLEIEKKSVIHVEDGCSGLGQVESSDFENSKYINLIKPLIEKGETEDDLDCISQMILYMDANERHTIIEDVNDNFRSALVERMFEYLNYELRRFTIDNYRIGKTANVSEMVKLVQDLIEFMSKSDKLQPRDIRSIINGIHQIPEEFPEFARIKIGEFDRILNNVFIVDMIESDLCGFYLEGDFYNALTELIKHSDLSKYDSDDQFCIENLSCVLFLIVDQFEKQFLRTDRLKIDNNFWKVEIKGGDDNEDITKTFLYCQKVAHIFQMSSTAHIPHEYFEAVKKCALSILRLNVFSKMFLFPKKALSRGFVLQLELQQDKIFVPMISIHHLSDYEILFDFVQRVFLLGWTKKSQFEEVWMSLFGVLCSTPIGNELNGEGVQQIIDQLSASTLAVEALTGMLTMSLLYPTPGDTINSRFLVKTRQTRDSYLFLNSLNGRRAAISRTQVEKSFNPSQVFSANLEKLNSDGQKYGLGQTSVYYLWSITGELEFADRQKNRMPQSVSDYLIQASTDLDTVSSLKSLFENFFHWFENGFKSLPIPLLAASIKSIAILSDMFDDINLYVRVYGYLKNIYLARYLQNHPSQGLLSYIILKFVAIIDLERLDPDPDGARKLIESIIIDSLEHNSTFVIDSTLHGLMYLLQSVIVEEFQQPLKAVGAKVLQRLEKIHSNYDLIYREYVPHKGFSLDSARKPKFFIILSNQEFETVEHQRLLWTFIFRYAEQFGRGDSEFDQRFLKLARSVFIDPRVATWQKNIVSAGIQGLICHSVSFTEPFRECVVELFDTYQLRPNHLSMTLSVYFTCVYRSMQDQGRFTQHQMDQFRQELQKILNLFSYYTLKSEIQQFLPPIADCFLVFFTRNELFDTIFALLSLDDKSETIGDYDRCLYHLLHYTLQQSAKEKPKETVDFIRFFLLEKVENVKSNKVKQYLKSIIMASVGDTNEARIIMPMILRRRQEPELHDIYETARNIFLAKAKSLNIKLGEKESSLIT